MRTICLPAVILLAMSMASSVEAVISGRTVATHVPAGGSFRAGNDDRVLIYTGDSQDVSSVRIGGPEEPWTPGRTCQPAARLDWSKAPAKR